MFKLPKLDFVRFFPCSVFYAQFACNQGGKVQAAFINTKFGKSRAFLFSRMNKSRNTLLKQRLVALTVGNYAVGLRAPFASSYEISSIRGVFILYKYWAFFYKLFEGAHSKVFNLAILIDLREEFFLTKNLCRVFRGKTRTLG